MVALLLPARRAANIVSSRGLCFLGGLSGIPSQHPKTQNPPRQSTPDHAGPHEVCAAALTRRFSAGLGRCVRRYDNACSHATRLSALQCLTPHVAFAAENVAVLTPDNFDAFIKAQPLTIVEFYAPWCGHCKSLAPEWAAAGAKTRMLEPAVPLAKVDADQHQELASRFDVSGYPTIKIFKDGQPSEYEGPRDAKGIVKFVRQAAGISGGASLARYSSAGEYDALRKESGHALLGTFREPVGASKIFAAFSEAAAELPAYTKKPVKVGYAASYKPEALPGARKSVPSIVLVRPGEEDLEYPIPRRRDEFTEEALLEWLKAKL